MKPDSYICNTTKKRKKEIENPFEGLIFETKSHETRFHENKQNMTKNCIGTFFKKLFRYESWRINALIMHPFHFEQ